MTIYHQVSRLALALALSWPAAAWTQEPPPPPPSPAADDDYHNRTDAEIVVTAAGLTQLDTLAGTSVVEGLELQRSMAGQIGEVLAKQPGVTASGFSPGASRPILRGFSGERVKVLVDGIGAIDVSNTSADHAVSIDPLTAERIEVLRGPAVMLYGSQAIGGAVNVIDKRIPQRPLDEPVHVDAIAAADTAYDLREGGGSLDVGLGGGFVAHLDGSWRQTDDMRIPGLVVSERLRADLLDEADEEAAEGHLDEAAELREAADLRGVLPDSATKTWSANAGLALFRGASNLGASLGVYDTTYGVPSRPGAGHGHEPGAVDEGDVPISIGLRQYRADLRARMALGGALFEGLNVRAGYSDYSHTEFEGDKIGTVFEVDGLESRVELVQAKRGSWRGQLGGQYYFRDFRATGVEAYIPPNLTDQWAVFALQEVTVGPLQIEAAGRYERTNVSSGRAGFERSFDAGSGALSVAHETDKGLRFGINLSRVARAPSAEELLADGAHIATQAYEIGNRDLELERAWGVEAFIRGKVGPGTVSLAGYRSRFSGYIYQEETGAEIDGLPVLQTVQRAATYSGLEGEFSYPVIDSGPFTLLAECAATSARLVKNGTPAARASRRCRSSARSRRGPIGSTFAARCSGLLPRTASHQTRARPKGSPSSTPRSRGSRSADATR